MSEPSWWQKRQARKKLEKLNIPGLHVNELTQELEQGYKQTKQIRNELRKLESPTYHRLIGTINQIIEGTAPLNQKKLISIKLVECADLSEYEKNDLLQQIEYIYKDVQERQDRNLDQLIEQATNLVKQEQKASTAMLQRELKINYATASTIMARLESNGAVGPSDGIQPRKVFIK